MAKNYYRIKEALKEKGKSQIWLADKLNLDAVTISRYCNNHRQPSMETLERIAKALGVKGKDLLNF